MSRSHLTFLRQAALFAINVLFLMVWGFTGVGKVLQGMPAWFPDKFGRTMLAAFPGLTLAFWMLALGELLGFALAGVALFKGEFLERRTARVLPAMLVWSLFLFVQLGFGQWLTAEYNATAQLFMYFSGTLLALIFVTPEMMTAREVGVAQRDH